MQEVASLIVVLQCPGGVEARAAAPDRKTASTMKLGCHGKGRRGGQLGGRRHFSLLVGCSSRLAVGSTTLFSLLFVSLGGSILSDMSGSDVSG